MFQVYRADSAPTAKYQNKNFTLMPRREYPRKWTEQENRTFLRCISLYGNRWKQFTAEFPERSLASIKCKYHNEITKLQHGARGPNIFKGMPLFNDIQGGRRTDQLFIQNVLSEPGIVGFRYCDPPTQQLIFRLFITMVFSDIELEHTGSEKDMLVADAYDLQNASAMAFQINQELIKNQYMELINDQFALQSAPQKMFGQMDGIEAVALTSD